jgi:hypothetical protein
MGWLLANLNGLLFKGQKGHQLFAQHLETILREARAVKSPGKRLRGGVAQE